MIGRIFDGMGNVMDDGPEPRSDFSCKRTLDNPVSRDYPMNLFKQGISAIDHLNTLFVDKITSILWFRASSQRVRQLKSPVKRLWLK